MTDGQDRIGKVEALAGWAADGLPGPVVKEAAAALSHAMRAVRATRTPTPKMTEDLERLAAAAKRFADTAEEAAAAAEAFLADVQERRP